MPTDTHDARIFRLNPYLNPGLDLVTDLTRLEEDGRTSAFLTSYDNGVAEEVRRLQELHGRVPVFVRPFHFIGAAPAADQVPSTVGVCPLLPGTLDALLDRFPHEVTEIIDHLIGYDPERYGLALVLHPLGRAEYGVFTLPPRPPEGA